MLLTYLAGSNDVGRSRRFCTEVLGGETDLDADGFAIIAIANRLGDYHRPWGAGTG